ncbi:EthD family reductase [Methylobacterium organophilum]|uniref:EthD domain-containing protein n=1 Tax=Methylobacterium organophilum TaxID=410 RepID=A0ABQ4TCU2_METOR|nr:EthD family reductase [Methylobacterium organophilum]GJE27877.1 hypothetical protein LKMONMHP_2739 [Methylobacterium organophilum]
MTLVSVMYPGGADARFDMDYYLTKHMPLVAERWSALGLKEAKVVKGVATPDGAPAPYPVIALLTWDSADAFSAAVARHGAEIFGDIPNFTNTQPSVQINDVAWTHPAQ